MPPNKVLIHYLGDSHVCDHHWLPQELSYELERQGGSGRYARLYANDLCRPGLRLDADYVDKIVALMRREAGQARLYILQAGGNNIRHLGDEDNRDSLWNLGLLVQRVIQEAEVTENAHLVVISPIPDLKGFTDADADELDKDLQERCKEANATKVSYCPFRSTRFPIPEEGDDRPRFDPRYFSDEIHLSREGVMELAKQLYGVLLRVPNLAFGRPKYNRAKRWHEAWRRKNIAGKELPGDDIRRQMKIKREKRSGVRFDARNIIERDRRNRALPDARGLLVRRKDQRRSSDLYLHRSNKRPDDDNDHHDSRHRSSGSRHRHHDSRHHRHDETRRHHHHGGSHRSARR